MKRSCVLMAMPNYGIHKIYYKYSSISKECLWHFPPEVSCLFLPCPFPCLHLQHCAFKHFCWLGNALLPGKRRALQYRYSFAWTYERYLKDLKVSSQLPHMPQATSKAKCVRQYPFCKCLKWGRERWSAQNPNTGCPQTGTPHVVYSHQIGCCCYLLSNIYYCNSIWRLNS